jgi:ABC-type nickel/cobalt efflux system permease component RcnA
MTIRMAAVCTAVLLFVCSMPLSAPVTGGASSLQLGMVSVSLANPFTRGAHSRSPNQADQVNQVDKVGEQVGPQGAGHAVMSPGNATREEAVQIPVAVTGGEPLSHAEAGFLATQYTRMLRTVTVMQKEMREKLSELGKDIAANPAGSSFWTFIGLSFVYGVVHALGPGHGKAVVFSYFLGKRGSIARGFAMGHLLSFVHAMSAVVLVFVLQWMLGNKGSQGFDEAGGVLQHISYGLVAVIGLLMLVHALYETFSGRQAARICCAAAPQAGYGGIAAVSMLAGLVPCPGAALVLAFAMGLGLPWTGFLAVLALALGMGLTTSLFGVLSIASRGALVHVAGRGPRLLTTMYSCLAIGGALGITVLGTMLFLSARC